MLYRWGSFRINHRCLPVFQELICIFFLYFLARIDLTDGNLSGVSGVKTGPVKIDVLVYWDICCQVYWPRTLPAWRCGGRGNILNTRVFSCVKVPPWRQAKFVLPGEPQHSLHGKICLERKRVKLYWVTEWVRPFDNFASQRRVGPDWVVAGRRSLRCSPG